MERIIFAINSNQVDSNSIDFACYITKVTKSKLSVLLLRNRKPEVVYADSGNKSFYKKVAETAVSDKRFIRMDVDQEIKFLLAICERNGVKGDVIVRRESYVDKDSPACQAIRESRFADLLIIDPRTTFNDDNEGTPTAFVKAVVTGAECPVLIAPTSFDRIDDIVFCYDGSRSSVFAMQQFICLFPQFSDKNVIILEVDGDHNIKQHEKIAHWLQAYYSKINFQELEGVPAEEIFKYFLMKKNLIVVMGGYGRNRISNFFKKSSADLVMRVVDVPLFISHH